MSNFSYCAQMVFVSNLGGPLQSKASNPEEVYRVGLVLSGDNEESKLSNLILKNEELSCMKSGLSSLSSFPFTCEGRFNSPGIPMQLSDVFEIQPVFDVASGT